MFTSTKAMPKSLSRNHWINLGVQALIFSVPTVVITQAIALLIWPDIRLFEPLNSFGRSALFTAVPVIGATLLFAFLYSRIAQPKKLFNRIAFMVLVISIIPDYLLPVPHKTFLASTVTAFLHVVAGVITILVLQQGVREVKKPV